MHIPFKPTKKFLGNYPDEEYKERTSYIFIDNDGEKCYYIAHRKGEILVTWSTFNKINKAGVSIFTIEEFKKRFRFKKYVYNASVINFKKWLRYKKETDPKFKNYKMEEK